MSRTTSLLGIVLVVQALVLPGCVRYRPQPVEEAAFWDRVQVRERAGVRVSAAALGPSESRDTFGVDLARHGIQPVWLQIENGSDRRYVFLQQSVDPKYFAPREAAYRSHFSTTKRFLTFGLLGVVLWPALLLAPVQAASAAHANGRMDELFVERELGNAVIHPGARESGFVFTRIDGGTKQVDVALLHPEGTESFRMFAKAPGLRADHADLDPAAVYPSTALPNHDDWSTLRAAITALPCCTTNARAARNGDPLNLVVVASLDGLIEGFTAAVWDETEVLDLAAGWKTFRAFLLSSEYRYSPVSNLYLFGRKQDIAFQRARETIHERNHLRLWLAPFTFRGTPVWVGQVSRDIGVKFTLKTWNLTTHAIDDDIDDSRENVFGDLIGTDRLGAVAYLPGVGASDPAKPPTNLMGDTYRTDGMRLVVVLDDDGGARSGFEWLEDDQRDTHETP
jgi:hypothetical protein